MDKQNKVKSPTRTVCTHCKDGEIGNFFFDNYNRPIRKEYIKPYSAQYCKVYCIFCRGTGLIDAPENEENGSIKNYAPTTGVEDKIYTEEEMRKAKLGVLEDLLRLLQNKRGLFWEKDVYEFENLIDQLRQELLNTNDHGS